MAFQEPGPFRACFSKHSPDEQSDIRGRSPRERTNPHFAALMRGYSLRATNNSSDWSRPYKRRQ